MTPGRGEGQRDSETSEHRSETKGVRYPLALTNFTLDALHRCVHRVFEELCKIFHTRDESCCAPERLF